MFNCFRKLSEEEKLVKYFKKQDKIYAICNTCSHKWLIKL